MTEETKQKKKQPSHKVETVESTVIDAASSAHSEIESLAEEMRSWVDNLEEKFSATSRFEAASNAADTLEGISEVDVGGLDDDSQSYGISVSLSVSARKGRGLSRQARAGNAASYLDAASSALKERAQELRDQATAQEEVLEAHEEAKRSADEAEHDEDCPEDGTVEACEACKLKAAVDAAEIDEEIDVDELNQWADACEEVAQEFESAKDELEGVEFPGMFG
jgi:hypothetical protein